MPDITMYLTIEASDHFGSGTVYRKVIQTSFLPHIGDHVVIFPSNITNPDPSDGPEGIVKYVWWGTDGNVSLQFEHYVMNPNKTMELAVQNGYLHSWYLEQDGDLAAQLMSTGWRTDW